MADKKLYSVPEASAAIGITRQWFWALVKKHKIDPVQEYGRTRLFSSKDVTMLKIIVGSRK